MTHALSISSATKIYGDLTALRQLDLTVAEGEFFGLLGPNGAGKTTLISAIVGLCRLTSGSISVFGNDVLKAYMQSRKLIGYSPQEVNLDRFFSIRKILEYQAGFFGCDRAEQKKRVGHLLERFDLTSKEDKQYYKLSGGMQKRVLVAKALVNKPRLLILDEPTAGVDVRQRHELWKYLRELNADGTTIILTTHYIDEAEELCERIGIINRGEIREMGAPRDLIKKHCQARIDIVTAASIAETDFAGVSDFNVRVGGRHLAAEGGAAGPMMETIIARLNQSQNSLVDVRLNSGTLEDVFLKVTGMRLEEA